MQGKAAGPGQSKPKAEVNLDAIYLILPRDESLSKELTRVFKKRTIETKTLEIFDNSNSNESNKNYIFTENFILIIDVIEFQKIPEQIEDSPYVLSVILYCKDINEQNEYFYFNKSDPKIELITHDKKAVLKQIEQLDSYKACKCIIN